jgi:hypothetical protein
MTDQEKRRLAQALAIIAYDWIHRDGDLPGFEDDMLDTLWGAGDMRLFMEDITDKACLRGLYDDDMPNYYGPEK